MFLIISLFSFSTAHQTAFALHNKKDSSELDFRTAEPTLSKCYFSILEAYRQKQPPEVFYENVFPTNFSKFTGKHLCQSLFFKRFYYRFFPVNFPKFVGPLYLQNTVRRLLLHLEPCQMSMMQLFCGKSKSLTVFEKKLIIYI